MLSRDIVMVRVFGSWSQTGLEPSMIRGSLVSLRSCGRSSTIEAAPGGGGMVGQAAAISEISSGVDF